MVNPTAPCPLNGIPCEYAAMPFDPSMKESYFNAGVDAGLNNEREKIANWLRSLDKNEGGDINRFLPTTLANWIDEGMHNL